MKDGRADHITREPEQVKAFRDTWRDGIHSYLTYLRDRLTVARDLLADSGSIFVQIGDENVHRVRVVMDEVFGDGNCVTTITFAKTSGSSTNYLGSVSDHLLWYGKDVTRLKYRPLFQTKRDKTLAEQYRFVETPSGQILSVNDVEVDSSGEAVDGRRFMADNLTGQGEAGNTAPYTYQAREFLPTRGRHWSTTHNGLDWMASANRLIVIGQRLGWKRFLSDFSISENNNTWTDTAQGGRAMDRIYVVQTLQRVVERCVLMATDPGDLVLDPTCGSGTTATVAEQWGRRWITIDTSRVALALARARIMGARYPFYLLADSPDGQRKEMEIVGRVRPSGRNPTSPPDTDQALGYAALTRPTGSSLCHGFVYERVPHITLKSIANNAEIDVIWEKWQATLEPLCAQLNAALGRTQARHARGSRRPDTLDSRLRGNDDKVAWQEWEIPREAPSHWPLATQALLTAFWQARIARQKEIDASIAAKAEFEYLYDKPYEDKKKVRVAGPFTVESLSPHRVLGVDEHDELIDPFQMAEAGVDYKPGPSFEQMILENLKVAGVQQAHKSDKIVFTSLTGWPGELICAEGRYLEGGTERRAAIFIGPEFGTVSRPDLVEAAREAGDAGFDVLIACALNYEAPATELNKLGRIPVLKARMNADLHMAEDLKTTNKGNLFVIFGEPDIERLDEPDNRIRIRVRGVDVFDPSTGEVRSDSAKGIACWFIDTDYNGESFFVRHAYFLSQNDPYGALRTTLKAEINADAWASLHSDTSRAFHKPKSGRIAVKVINHLGDEVMKVFRV